MKKILLALVCLAAAANPVRAQKAGDLGAGVILGNPTGGTMKSWTTDNQAIDAGLGVSNHLTAYADYLWHTFTVFSQPAHGRLGLYFGAGAQVRTFHDAEFGVRTVAGVTYWLPNNPIEIFAEVVPVFRLLPGDSVGLDGGLGVRYYWKS
jgi:hypothetical protein